MRFICIVAATILFPQWLEAAQTESFDVYTSITSRFAETIISSTVRNDGNFSEEITFHALLPKEAFISGFSMTIDGKVYEAVVEEKQRAQRTFEAARAINRTAGLVATRDQSTKTFRTSVNVAARETVLFELKYQQLLRRIRGKFRNQIILLGSQLTDLLTIRVDICENQRITNVNVPPVLDSQGRNVSIKTLTEVQGNTARVDYLQGQNEVAFSTLTGSGGSFAVEYELEAEPNTGQVVLSNGYVAFFYAPDVEIEPRRIVFTLDLSSSMSGLKVNQLKEAMINIIRKLTVEDRFTIVTFSSSAAVWRRSEVLHVGTPNNIEEAQSFIRTMRAGGYTNIDAALKMSLRILNSDVNDSRAIDSSANYVVFLTDGRPSRGETRPARILDNVDELNTRRFAIHAIGFGLGVDASFLKALAARNDGTWTQILEDVNAALQIQYYLDELSVSFMRNLNITYPLDVMDALTIIHSDSMLAGGELMALGRLKDSINVRNRGPFTIQVTGGQNNTVSASAQFNLEDEDFGCRGIDGISARNFGKKAFALSNVMEILRLYDAETDTIAKETLKQEAINSSIEAGLVTPVTSLLVIKPEDREDIERQLDENEQQTASTPSPALRNSAAPIPRWQVQGDPHFLIQLSRNITACFNWLGKSGEVYNLLHDPERGITINGLMGGKESYKQGAPHAVYITQLVIILQEDRVIITIGTKEVKIKDLSEDVKSSRVIQLPVEHVKDYVIQYGRVTFTVSEIATAHTVLNVTIRGGVNFIVKLYHPIKLQTRYVEHLDLMISGSESLSEEIGGIFGQFPKGFTFTEDQVRIQKRENKTSLWYKDHSVAVQRKMMIVPYLHRSVPCWYVPNPEKFMGFSQVSFKLEHFYQEPNISTAEKSSSD